MAVDLEKVFFSYARADSQFVLDLANDLRSAGVHVWIDQQDILPGERWDNAIQKALTTAPCLLVVLSPESVASQSVMDEVAFALQCKKRVVPVLYKACEIPFRIQRLQYIDFTTSYDKGLRQLIGTLKVAPPSESTQVSVQADPQENVQQSISRSRRGANITRLIYLLGLVLLIGVIAISYWIYSGRRTKEVDVPSIGTHQGKVGAELRGIRWSFQVVDISEANAYAERYYQANKIIQPQGTEDVLLIVNARLKNLTQKTESPVLTERLPGNTGLIDSQGHSYQPLDYDARQESDKVMSYAGAALLPGAVADFALVFSVPKGTRPRSLVCTIKAYADSKGEDFQVSLGK